VPLHDRLAFATAASLILTCNRSDLPAGPENLVYRAAAAFLQAANCREGVKIHLEKKIPLAAGLGGGSGNAATTLKGLNELFGRPLKADQLHQLAAELGILSTEQNYFFLQRHGHQYTTSLGQTVASHYTVMGRDRKSKESTDISLFSDCHVRKDTNGAEISILAQQLGLPCKGATRQRRHRRAQPERAAKLRLSADLPS